jgi:hypothetical protein
MNIEYRTRNSKVNFECSPALRSTLADGRRRDCSNDRCSEIYSGFCLPYAVPGHSSDTSERRLVAFLTDIGLPKAVAKQAFFTFAFSLYCAIAYSSSLQSFYCNVYFCLRLLSQVPSIHQFFKNNEYIINKI